MRNVMTSYDRNTRRPRVRRESTCECGGITRLCIDGSLARDEDGGRRRQRRRCTRQYQGVNCARLCRRQRLLWFFRVTNFSGLLWMQLRTKPPSSEGATELSKGYQAACQPQGHYERTCLKQYMFRRGCVWKCEHVLWSDPMQVLPAGRAASAEGGVAVHRGDAKWSCPD